MQAGLERCLAFVQCQLQPAHSAKLVTNGRQRWRAVTVSRQTGSGGHTVAEKLAEYLQAHVAGRTRPWMVFDRNLVEKVLEDYHLPQRLARFMPEDRISEIDDTIEELLGLHPPSWTLVRKTTEKILHLAELGNVILLGRGANVITSKLGYVFHVSLVASLEKRVAHIQEFNHLEKKAALEFIRREDRGRSRYLKKYFRKDMDDPLLYHLTINTDFVSYEEAVRIISEAVIRRSENRLKPIMA